MLYLTRKERFARTIQIEQHLLDLIDIHGADKLRFDPVGQRGLALDDKVTCVQASELTLEILAASGITPGTKPN
jgi:hypothetical protein